MKETYSKKNRQASCHTPLCGQTFFKLALLGFGFYKELDKAMIPYFVVFITIECLPLTALSFSFTRTPDKPMVVVLNSNSTNVDLKWDFSLDSGDVFSNLRIRRYGENKGVASRVELVFYQVGYTNVNSTLYTFRTNVTHGPSSGYVKFTIKDIMKQTNNNDGTRADPRSTDYIYEIEIGLANILDGQVSDAQMRVLVLPESTSISISPNQSSFCLGSQVTISCTSYAKPPANYSLYHNTKLIRDDSTSGVFSVTLNDTGKNNYTCVPYNIVGFGQKRSLDLLVKGPLNTTRKCTINNEEITHKNVTEGSDVLLHFNSFETMRLDFAWKNMTVKIFGEVGHNLSLKSITRYQGGMYQVVARDKFNCSANMECRFTLNVQYLPGVPKFNATPTTVCQNRTVDLTCANADANPQVNNYTLYDDANRLLNYSTNGHFKVRATTIGENTFWCFPSNVVGRGKNVSTKINVVGPLNIILYKNNTVPLPEPLVLSEGTSASVTLSYSYHLDVKWEKLGENETGGKSFTENSIYGLTFSPVNRSHNGTYKVTALVADGCVSSRTFRLSVYFLDSDTPRICKNKQLGLIEDTRYGFNVNGYPYPSVRCIARNSPPKLSYDSSKNGFHEVNVPNDVEQNCTIENEAGRCKFTLCKRIPQETLKATCKIMNRVFVSQKKDELSNTVTEIFKSIYLEQPCYTDVEAVELLEGSVIVNFKVIVVGAVADYLQPLKHAIIENSPKLLGLDISLESIQKGYTKKEDETDWILIIIIIIVAVVLVLVVIVVLLVRYRKKKKSQQKGFCFGGWKWCRGNTFE